MNSAGPPAVAPYGSIDPITGTNPICFAFPKSDGGIHAFDMATSEIVWGEIRQAALEGRRLPAGPFIDSAGDVTTDPTKVSAARVFGGKKGSALNIAIEILSGALSQGQIGLQCENEYDCGAFFMAIDPQALGIELNGFTAKIEQLFQDIREARAEISERPVRVPGDSGRSALNIDDFKDAELDVPKATLTMLERMAKGEDVSELASNPLFN
jgi:LDH2 family malate/lactate/ureidoglycolate dehydrogenase